MKQLQHYAFRDPDGPVAELTMLAAITMPDADAIACAACRIERATEACSMADHGVWLSYGLCKACYAQWPGDAVTKLVERAITSGRLIVHDDDFEEDEL